MSEKPPEEEKPGPEHIEAFWQARMKAFETEVRDFKVRAAVAYYELQKEKPNIETVNSFLSLLWRYLQDFRYEQITEIVADWACDAFEVDDCTEIIVEYDDDAFTLDVKEVPVEVTLPGQSGVRNVKLVTHPLGPYEFLLWGKFNIVVS